MGAFRIFRRFAELFDRETVDLPAINTPLADALAGKADIDGTENFEVTGLLTANHIHGDLAGSLYVHVYLQEAVSKGDPVYVSGYDSGLGQPKVRRARADDALKMPAIGVMDADYDADQGGANCVISGIIEGLDLSNGFAINEPIYVAETGGFTSTQPSSNVQQVGICDRAQQNNGSFVVTTQSVKPNQDLNTDSDVEFVNLNLSGRLDLEQSADELGIKVVGFDDQADENFQIFIRSSGHARMIGTNAVFLLSGDNYGGAIRSGASGGMDWDAFNQFTFSAESPTRVPVNIQGATAQTNDLFNITTSGGSDGDLLTVTNSGKVGIGEDAPDRRLHVKDTSSTIIAKFENPNVTSSFVCFSNAQSIADQVRVGSISGNLVFSTNYAERARIDSAGNFGIGITVPQSALHVGPNALVSGYTPDRTVLSISDTGAGAGLILRGKSPWIWYDITSGGMGELYLDGAQYNILSGKPQTGAEGSSRFYIKASGEVGIGTKDPNAKLQVGDGSSDARVRAVGSDSTYAELANTGLQLGRYYSYIRRSANNGVLGIGTESVTWTEINFHAQENNFFGGGTDNERLTLSCDSAGDATIDVQSDTGGSGSGDLIINADRIGVNTSTPGTIFEIQDETSNPGTGLSVIGGGWGEALATFSRPVGTLNYGVEINAASSDAQIIFKRFGSDITDQHFTIGRDQSENNFVISSAKYLTDESAHLFVVSHAGNVGIGTISPARKLHVSDAMRLEPSSAPASPSAGDLYFDSTTNKLRCYDGTAWNDCF